MALNAQNSQTHLRSPELVYVCPYVYVCVVCVVHIHSLFFAKEYQILKKIMFPLQTV